MELQKGRWPEDFVAASLRTIDEAEESFHASSRKRSVKFANAIGDVANGLDDNINTGQAVNAPAAAIYNSEPMKVAHDGVSAVIDSLPVVLKVLDEISKLHPFIGAALLAFRAVIALDKKRRENDRKIAVLLAEMRDMLSALKPLATISPVRAMPGPDGKFITIEERLKDIIDLVVQDIKSCANVCDTYAKKHLISKVFKSNSWDSTLADFAGTFAKRREAITFNLSIHVGAGIDDARRHLSNIDEKVDQIRETLKSLVSPEMLQVSTPLNMIARQDSGVLGEEAIKEIMKHVPGLLSNLAKRREGEVSLGQFNKDEMKEVLAIKQELSENVDDAVHRNLQIFEQKFFMQQAELKEEIQKIVRHEGDRVIDMLKSGAHDRILDPSIHDIWLEMRWPGHVKARHFVVALRDYYRRQMEKRMRGHAEVGGIHEDDEWTLEWITPNRLQALAEAFDDDASGFITVAEVNQLTSSRPRSWSLPHWLAYWAIGWQMTMTYYAVKITEMRAKMMSIRPRLHRANRIPVYNYLDAVFVDITTLTRPFRVFKLDGLLRDRFQDYVDAEERRLEEKLKSFRYKIDALDTLSLITGTGRIEKYLMPLLYLLIRRDLFIIRLCESKVIDENHLVKSARSISCVVDAVINRHNDLEALFRQQRLDPAQQFKFFASGTFETAHNSKDYWTLANLRRDRFRELKYDDWEKEEIPEEIVSLSPEESTFKLDPEIHFDEDAEDAAKMIVGRWNGFQGAERWPDHPMMTFFIRPSANKGEYEASDADTDGNEFKISGKYEKQDDGSITYSFSLNWVHQSNSDCAFIGTLGDDGMTLSGTWGNAWEANRPHRFLFKRVAQVVLIARPSLEEFDRNRIQALWAYARTASLNDARRKLFSWSYVKERLGLMKDFLKLSSRFFNEDSEANSDLDRFRDQFAGLLRQLTFNEVRAAKYIWRSWYQPMPTGCNCDICEEPINGSRMVCLECGVQNTLDFCDKESCTGQVIETHCEITSPHLPTHDFMKIRGNVVYALEIGKVFNQGKEGVERARKLLEEAGKIIQASEGLANPDVGTESKSAAPPLKCVTCSAAISRPCWYCIDCPVDAKVFICKDCIDKDEGPKEGGHKRYHNLVRCLNTTGYGRTKEEANSVEKRLDALEARLASFAGQLERIEQLFSALRPLNAEGS